MDKLLSIGSVVLLKEINRRVMIIGYYPTTMLDDKEVTYDYSGCFFPEGLIDSKKAILFNRDEIEKLFHYGLMDEEQVDFIEKLTEYVEEEFSKEQKDGEEEETHEQ